jgi:serine/threonine protein kinase/tetratricopeptide (TPR) repeat protein
MWRMAEALRADGDGSNPHAAKAMSDQDDDANRERAQGAHHAETVVAGPRAASTSTAPLRPQAAATGSVADLDEFQGVLIELGLITSGELAAFQVDPSAGVLGLAQALARCGRLTPYQSAAIYQKKSRGLLVGKYLILDKLGQGGMGVVFKAKQRTTGKIVALKILPPSFARDQQAVSRFKREIDAAGRLNHPNIVAALDADEDRGVHFLVMDYVEGRDLDRVVRTKGPFPVAQAIDCVVQAARGLETAHALGIVHRDIKPANLMLDAAGTVRVLDLGLARIVESANPFGQTTANRLTQSGMYMGTIDYMAPEQAEDSRRADHRADIYSLGCTLYYLLTGQEPFPADTILKRLMAHQERPAPKLRTACPDVPPALELAFQKMMAKQPSERPATMTEVVALLGTCQAAAAEAKVVGLEASKSRYDLKVFDEPLKHARPAKTQLEPANIDLREAAKKSKSDDELRLEDLDIDVRSEPPVARALASPRSAKTSPQKRTIAVVAAIGAATLLGITVLGITLLSGSGGRQPEPMAKSSEVTAEEGGSVSQRAQGNNHAGSEIADNSGRREGDLGESKSLASNGGGATGTKPSQLVAPPEPYVETASFHASDYWVEQVRLFPDGKTLLTAGHDGSARLCDLRTGREIRRLWHPAGIRTAVLLPDGRRAVTGCDDGFVRLWDLQTGKLIRNLVKHAGPAITVTASADGRFIISGGNEPFLRVSDVEKGGEIRQIPGQASSVWSLAVSADAQRVLSGDYDGFVRFGELKSADPLVPLERHPGWVFGLAFAPDDQHAVSSCVGQLNFWDLRAKKLVRQKDLDDRQLAAITLADRHRLVFCSHLKREDNGVSNDGCIGTWDFESNESPRIIQSGPPGHLSLALLPQGGIVTGDVDGFARVWEPSASIAHARQLVAAGKKVESLAEYAAAIAKRPEDARLTIERGRLSAELGRTSEADADLTRAAQLAPDNPQLFVDSGWWVAGPYPPDFEWPVESESASDPSAPPPSSGNEPRQWRRVATRPAGNVDFASELSSFNKNVTGYAMTLVYSTEERRVVLLMGTDDLGRVWFNGRQVLDSKGYTAPGSNPVEVTLKQGRNSLVARVVNTGGPHELHLKIGDKPADWLFAHFARELWSEAVQDYTRGLAEEPTNLDTWFYHRGGRSLAQTRRYKDAIAAYRQSIKQNPGFFWNWQDLVHCELALGDLTSYRGTCRQMLRQFRDAKDPVDANNVAWTAVLAADTIADYHRLEKAMQPLLDARNAGWTYLNTYGALLYRKGDYRGAVNYLRKSIAAQKNVGSWSDWVFVAMALHRQRLPGDHDALANAKRLAAKATLSWVDKIETTQLLDEATRELRLPPPR